MFFEFSNSKVLFLGGIGLLMVVALIYSSSVVTAALPVRQEIGNATWRERAELEYWAFYKLPGEVGAAAAYLGLAHNQAVAVSPAPTGYATSVPVLLYHGEGAAASTMPTGVFVDQMRALKNAGWRTITLAQFEAFMAGKAQVPQKSFLLTFDDGRTDTFYSADPVLKDLGFTGVMFVITGFSLPNNGNGSISTFYLSKAMLAYMQASGRWELESHGDQDHRVYTVPTATSTAASVTEVGGQHFLSNLFWLPADGRLETPAEYNARVTNDLTVSKQILDSDFNAQVTAFAYPFNDYGEDTLNYSAAQSTLNQIIPLIYSYAFYQTSPGNGDTFNYPDPGAYMVKRFEPQNSWTGADLIAMLNSASVKSLPYTASTFGQEWQVDWGSVSPGAQLGLAADQDTTGATTFLDGSEHWTNYSVSATADVSVGTLELLARHTESNEPYLSCAFANNRIYLERHDGTTETTLATVNYSPPQVPATIAATMAVDGSTATCSAYGATVSATTAISPYGGVGVSIWDPETGTAKASIMNLSARAL